MVNGISRRSALLRLSAAALGASALPALAQAWPVRPVRIVLPYAPGGSVDIVTRLLAQKLGSSLGQPFVVENRPGASGNIGTEAVAKAAADGYTLLAIPDSNATTNPHLYAGLSVNPEKDLAPISMLTRIGVGLVVNPSVPATTVSEYLAYARTVARGLSYASPGTGTPHHLAGELLKQVSGVNLVHIPYKGGGPALVDIVGNQVPSGFVALAIAAPQVKAGKVRLLAVTQSVRSPNFPSVPTVGETVKGFDVTSWIGLFAPAGTPPDIVQRLAAEVRKALADAATAKSLGEQSLEVVASSPSELAERVHAESVRWAALIKANGITANP